MSAGQGGFDSALIRFKGDKMKLCKDCKYYKNVGNFENSCEHPYNASPVDGKPDLLCSTLRSGVRNCSEDGKWFEPIDEEVVVEEETPKNKLSFFGLIWLLIRNKI